jgi:hypothetical protein
MLNFQASQFRPVTPPPRGRGLSCDERGLFLGPRCGLVQIEAGRYVARSRREMGAILRSAYGYGGDPAPLCRALDGIRDRLEADDLAGAGEYASRLALPDLADDHAITALDRTLTLLQVDPEAAIGLGC